MDLSSFHSSWLALGAQSKGCVPSCFPQLCHVLAFSVSPTGAGPCSGKPAAFEVHHRQVGMKTASNQWRFRFQAHLFDHADLLPDFQDRAEAHELMAYLFRTSASSFEGSTAMSILGWWSLLHYLFDCTEWDVNLSGLQSIKWLGSIAIALANMSRIVVSSKTLDIQLVTAGVDATPSRQSLSKKLLQTGIALILMGCDTSMVDIWYVLKVFHFHVCMGSRTNWPRVNCWSCKCHAICDNSLGHHQNCLHNVRKLPYDHLVLAILTCNYVQLYTCRSTGCFTSCFLIGAMRWLSCKSAAKSISRFDLDQRNISGLQVRCCHSGR